MDTARSRAQASASAAENGRAWKKWAFIPFAGLALVALLVFFDLRILLRDALDYVDRLGAWGPTLFILLYVLATVLFVPGSVLTLGAGALFGVVWGSIYVSLASICGATAAFLVGRYLARDWVSKKIEGNASFSAIDRAVADQAWKIVGLTRLSPVFPFTLLNYAFGLTSVKLRDYVLASWVGMLPGTVMYVYVGSLGRAATSGQQRTPMQWGLYAVGLAATVAVTVIITRIARRALAKTTRTEK